MADHTPYQRKIIDRYYKNLDAIQFQRLSELATDLYLAEGKKRDRLWSRVEESLRKLEFPEPRIALLLQKRDPALLVGDPQRTRKRSLARHRNRHHHGSSSFFASMATLYYSMAFLLDPLGSARIHQINSVLIKIELKAT